MLSRLLFSHHFPETKLNEMIQVFFAFAKSTLKCFKFTGKHALYSLLENIGVILREVIEFGRTPHERDGKGRERSVMEEGRLITFWLKELPMERVVRDDGRLLIGWLKEEPMTSFWREGRLVRGWLNAAPTVKCWREEGDYQLSEIITNFKVGEKRRKMWIGSLNGDPRVNFVKEGGRLLRDTGVSSIFKEVRWGGHV